MKYDKRIYWRDDMKASKGKRFANIHILEGYNQRSLADYKAMTKELRKTFPWAKDCEISCNEIRESSTVKHFTMIAFDAEIENKEYEGWTVWKSMNYHW